MSCSPWLASCSTTFQCISSSPSSFISSQVLLSCCYDPSFAMNSVYKGLHPKSTCHQPLLNLHKELHKPSNSGVYHSCATPVGISFCVLISFAIALLCATMITTLAASLPHAIDIVSAAIIEPTSITEPAEYDWVSFIATYTLRHWEPHKAPPYPRSGFECHHQTHTLAGLHHLILSPHQQALGLLQMCYQLAPHEAFLYHMPHWVHWFLCYGKQTLHLRLPAPLHRVINANAFLRFSSLMWVCKAPKGFYGST